MSRRVDLGRLFVSMSLSFWGYCRQVAKLVVWSIGNNFLGIGIPPLLPRCENRFLLSLINRMS